MISGGRAASRRLCRRCARQSRRWRAPVPPEPTAREGVVGSATGAPCSSPAIRRLPAPAPHARSRRSSSLARALLGMGASSPGLAGARTGLTTRGVHALLRGAAVRRRRRGRHQRRQRRHRPGADAGGAAAPRSPTGCLARQGCATSSSAPPPPMHRSGCCRAAAPRWAATRAVTTRRFARRRPGAIAPARASRWSSTPAWRATA